MLLIGFLEGWSWWEGWSLCESAQTLLILRCNLCVFFFFFLQKEKKNMKMVLMGRGTYIERIVRERERESGALGG